MREKGILFDLKLFSLSSEEIFGFDFEVGLCFCEDRFWILSRNLGFCRTSIFQSNAIHF